MYKTTIFLVVFISLSIVTVGANILWDRGSKKSGSPVDSQNQLALDSLSDPRWPAYTGPSEEGKKKVKSGDERERKSLYSNHSADHDAESDRSLGSKWDSKEGFDVEATQDYIAALMARPDQNKRGGGIDSSSRGRGIGGRSGGGGGSSGSDGRVPEAYGVADGEKQDIPDWVTSYSPFGDEKPGDLPDELGTSYLMPFDLGNPVPEPATMILFGAGLASLVGYRLRRKDS